MYVEVPFPLSHLVPRIPKRRMRAKLGWRGALLPPNDLAYSTRFYPWVSAKGRGCFRPFLHTLRRVSHFLALQSGPEDGSRPELRACPATIRSWPLDGPLREATVPSEAKTSIPSRCVAEYREISAEGTPEQAASETDCFATAHFRVFISRRDDNAKTRRRAADDVVTIVTDNGFHLRQNSIFSRACVRSPVTPIGAHCEEVPAVVLANHDTEPPTPAHYISRPGLRQRDSTCTIFRSGFCCLNSCAPEILDWHHLMFW